MSLFGSEITRLALPLVAVATLHAGPAQLGLLGAMTYLPFLVLALPAGALVDRCRRRPIMIAADLAQVAALALVPLLAATGALTIDWLLVAAAIAGTGQMFFEVAYRAFLPSLVDSTQLTTANARLTSSESLAEVAGPAAGGWLVSWLGAPFALLADATSFLASAAGLAAIKVREPRPSPPVGRLRTQLAESFRFTFRDRHLRAFLGEAATYNLFWQIVTTLLALYAVQTLELSPTVLGLVLAIGSLGALLGAVTTGRLARRFGLGRTLVGAAVVGDVGPLVLPFLPPGPVGAIILSVAFFVRGIGVTACNVHVMAIRQAVTPNQLLGRTNAAYRFVGHGVVPLGALAAGVLGDQIGVRATMAIGAAGLLGSCLWLILSPIRRLRRLDEIVTT